MQGDQAPISPAPLDGMGADDAVARLFLTEEGLDDPVPLYHHLRAVAPVHRSGTGAIFLTRFDDCRPGAARQPVRQGAGRAATSASSPTATRTQSAFRQAQLPAHERAERRATSMLFLDPPHHTRQRRLVSRAFTPRGASRAAARLSIGVLADRAAPTTLVAAGGGDLLEIGGVSPPRRRHRDPGRCTRARIGPHFRARITSACRRHRARGVARRSAAPRRAANDETVAYFQPPWSAERRQGPPRRSPLRAHRRGGVRRRSEPEGEVIAVAILLFAGGFRDHHQPHRQRYGGACSPTPPRPSCSGADARPDHRPPSTRCSAGTQPGAGRRASGARAGRRRWAIPSDEGQAVVTLLGAANRDPDHFADPDRFDITRDRRTSAQLRGSGIHHCLGANLARAEGQEVFRSLRWTAARTIEPTDSTLRPPATG